MGKRPLTREDLEAHLAEQVAFIEASADAFDRGNEIEAKRLATHLRVLLHDTGKSHSLLTQLGLKGGDFWDTALPPRSDNPLTHHGLIGVMLGTPGKYMAPLDEAPFTDRISFDTWWNAVVFIDGSRRSFSRKQLVLTAANQDGGAHVDPALDEAYAGLAKGNSLNWFAMKDGKMKAMASPERAALRQIAHEILKTLKPGYTKRRLPAEGPMLLGMQLNFSPVPGPSEPCICGSRKQYRDCHGPMAPKPSPAHS